MYIYNVYLYIHFWWIGRSRESPQIPYWIVILICQHAPFIWPNTCTMQSTQWLIIWTWCALIEFLSIFLPCFLRNTHGGKNHSLYRMFKLFVGRYYSYYGWGPTFKNKKTKKRKYLVFKKPTCSGSVFIWLYSVRCAADFLFCPIRKERQSGPSPALIYNRCTRTH